MGEVKGLLLYLAVALLLVSIVNAQPSLDELIANNVISYSDGEISIDTSKYEYDESMSLIGDGKSIKILYDGKVIQDVILVLDTELEFSDKFWVATGLYTEEEEIEEEFEESIENRKRLT